jgi:acetyl-CoA C-acetyltransferase
MSRNTNGTEVVISTPLRTAIGTFGGTLKDTPATELGAIVVQAVVSKSGVGPTDIDQVIVGNVLQAGQGMNPGRQVALKAGLPNSVPGMTLNRVCGSGLQSIVTAGQQVALGESEVVLAGGIENMDQAPFMLPKARYGYRMGMPSAELTDAMVYDGLWDIFNDYHMGITAENVAEKYGVSRDEADAYSAPRQRKTAASKNRLSRSRFARSGRPSSSLRTNTCGQPRPQKCSPSLRRFSRRTAP